MPILSITPVQKPDNRFLLVGHVGPIRDLKESLEFQEAVLQITPLDIDEYKPGERLATRRVS